MERVGHLYLILLAFLSIICQSKAGCYDGLDNESWRIFLSESITLVEANNFTTSMLCTVKYNNNNTIWERHLQGNATWKHLWQSVDDCIKELDENKCTQSQKKPKKVPLFYFLCFLAKSVNYSVKACGNYEIIGCIYSAVQPLNPEPTLTKAPTLTTEPKAPQPITNACNITNVDQTGHYGQKHVDNSSVKGEQDVFVMKNLLVISVILNILLPALVWLFMRRNQTLDMEQDQPNGVL